MTGTTADFGGTNNAYIISYEIQYNEGSTFIPGTPAPARVQTFTFTSFTSSINGLSIATDYYFTIRSICASDTGSWYDNGKNGPDLWTTTADCPNAIPYFIWFWNNLNNILNIKPVLKYIGTNYSVFDNSGKVVLNGLITSNLTTLNIENLFEGIYLLSIGDNVKRKFIILR